jgi:hypothetical protein
VRSEIERRPDLSFLMHLENGWKPPAPPQDFYACLGRSR